MHLIWAQRKEGLVGHRQWRRCSVFLLIAFFAPHNACAGTLTGNATCGSVGQHRRVTCHFSRDVNTVHGVTGVVLQRQTLNDTGSLPDFVAECHRVNGDPFMCMNNPGYRVHGVSDVLVVDILTEDADHEGRYSCILLPETLITYSEAQHCVLKFTRPGKITGSTVCDVTQQDDHNTVSCQFSEDIKKVKGVTGIVLMRHSLSDPNSLPDIVAECHRINGDPFMCILKSGYRLRGHVSNVTVVEILEKDSEQEGHYSCVLLPERLVTYTEKKHCVLNFNANKETPTLTDEGRNNANADKTPTTVTPGSAASETASRGNNCDSDKTIVLGSFLGLFLVSTIILAVIAVLLKRRCLQLKQQMAATSSAQELQEMTCIPIQIPYDYSTDQGNTLSEVTVPVLLQIRLKHPQTLSPTQDDLAGSSSNNTRTGFDPEAEEKR